MGWKRRCGRMDKRAEEGCRSGGAVSRSDPTRRFGFGRNWRAFLARLSDDQILEAEASLNDLLGGIALEGKRFLDVGSGSGLSSLAARRLGAHVTSFDYDTASVECTRELRSRFFPEDADWQVEQGSILDAAYVDSLGRFDIVHSWGVLHHTGDMWTAIGNTIGLVDDTGVLVLAIYNDQGRRSDWWRRIKQLYGTGLLGRLAVCSVFLPYYFGRFCAASVVKGSNQFTQYKKRRGMSVYYDWIDWLGGYPFEVAGVEAIVDFARPRGFEPVNVLPTKSGYGNNQFVFRRQRTGDPAC